MIRLILPTIEYKKSFLEGLKELQDEGYETSINTKKIDGDFKAFIKEVEEHIRGVAPDQKVPDTLFWIVDGDEWIGRLSLRHRLNENLSLFGGHIGCYIRPSKQNMGYATEALALALVEAKKLGIEKVLITCDEGNIPSQKVIEKNGGVLQDVIETELNPEDRIMRWWIDLSNI